MEHLLYPYLYAGPYTREQIRVNIPDSGSTNPSASLHMTHCIMIVIQAKTSVTDQSCLFLDVVIGDSSVSPLVLFTPDSRKRQTRGILVRNIYQITSINGRLHTIV